MVEYKINLPKSQNVIWLPKAVVETLGKKLRLLPDSNAALIYPQDADPEDVLSSLKIIESALALRKRISDKEG
jgi:hypothetical protein